VTPVRPHAALERELKFSVDADFTLPDLTLAALPEVTKGKTFTLTATYYDTQDLRLARARVTLRRRTGGKDAGWHLKLPSEAGDPVERTELQLPLTASKTPPVELSELVLGVTRTAPLQALATMRTRRTPIVVSTRRVGAARMAVEVVDDRVSVIDGPAAGLCYREIEAEALTPGADLDAVADLLVAQGARPGGYPSKGARALGAEPDIPPLVPSTTRAGPADPAALVVRNHLRKHTAVLLHQDLRVRRDLPDAVHQFRVAARRLRSGLQAFRPLVDDDWSRHLRAELGWIAGTLGAARDAEVLEDHLFLAIRDLPTELDRPAGLVAVQDELEKRIVDAERLRHEAMTSERYLTLLDELIAAAEVPHTTPLADHPAGECLPPLVSDRFERLSRLADPLVDELEGHDDDWHRARIAAKKARYVGEAVEPVFGRPARRYVKQIARVTELLGEHQDCAIAADTVRQLVTRDTGPQTALTLGAVYVQQRHRVRQIREEFLAEWPGIRSAKWRRWLAVASNGSR